jgi:hypothetical protein
LFFVSLKESKLQLKLENVADDEGKKEEENTKRKQYLYLSILIHCILNRGCKMRGSQNSSLEAVMEGDGFRLMVTHLRLQASNRSGTR